MLSDSCDKTKVMDVDARFGRMCRDGDSFPLQGGCASGFDLLCLTLQA